MQLPTLLLQLLFLFNLLVDLVKNRSAHTRCHAIAGRRPGGGFAAKHHLGRQCTGGQTFVLSFFLLILFNTKKTGTSWFNRAHRTQRAQPKGVGVGLCHRFEAPVLVLSRRRKLA